jgi:hypothetical protein
MRNVEYITNGFGAPMQGMGALQMDLHRPFNSFDRRSLKRFFRLQSGRLYESLSPRLRIFLFLSMRRSL